MMARLSVPTNGRLPSSLRTKNSNAVVQRTVNRISRSGLISLVLDWLDDANQALCPPLLDHDHDANDFHPPVASLSQLRQVYLDLGARKGPKREVVDRILEGDWRHGLSLYQLAMADMRYLQEHPTSQKWVAYRILPLATPSDSAIESDDASVDKVSLDVPRIHPSSFLQNLQEQVLPDVKAHYHLDRPVGHAVLIIRVFLIDSPYLTGTALGGDSAPVSSGFQDFADQLDTSRTLYIAFPDASPFVYLSKSQAAGGGSAGTTAAGSDSKAFRNLVAEGIPKALSRPQRRYTLKPANASTKNLAALVATKGPGRIGASGGGWSSYANQKKQESPLDPVLLSPSPSEEEGPVSTTLKTRQKRKASEMVDERFIESANSVARARFGQSAKPDDGKGMERLDVTMEDPFRGPAGLENGTEGSQANAGSSWTPSVKLTFRGPHVFAGVRQLLEHGIIDGERMPGWMTGEEGVTIGAVRGGRIRGHRGSGL